ncbi:MAG: hypothetical protein HY222_08525 [Thaumarchaeota archaeon]|nr:hypothetical protein [Nitrososphaerota archaeon]MBI3642420.1 hypothetical protein [Nitrososphaerota archaeon]
MSKIKTVAKVIVMIISGIAIVVVGGFMMGAIARLWTGKETKNPKDQKQNSDI